MNYMDCYTYCDDWCDKKNILMCDPKSISGLHTTTESFAKSILKNGFQHSKYHPERISAGRGTGEDDIIFFEKNNKYGLENIEGWTENFKNFVPKRGSSYVTLKSDICSCNFLDKDELEFNNRKIVDKSVDFIMDSLSIPKKDRKWAYEHFGERLKTYNDPFSFLRKVSIDSVHCTDEKGKRLTDYEEMNAAINNKTCKYFQYNIGEIMEYLGYDASDGYTGSSNRKIPINEFIVSDVNKIYNIEILK